MPVEERRRRHDERPPHRTRHESTRGRQEHTVGRVRAGRQVRRRKMATSWRRTTIWSSLKAFDRNRSATNSRTRRRITPAKSARSLRLPDSATSAILLTRIWVHRQRIAQKGALRICAPYRGQSSVKEN
jgi:hypothetical protein